MEEKRQPIYKQLSDELEKKITDNVYKAGQMIESEADFQRIYNVSRVTVRKALKILSEKGILTVIPGKGTFVNDIDSQDWTWMRSFTSDVIASGHIPTTNIISFKKIKAGAELVEKLQVKLDEDCYYFKRVRFIDNKPVWLTKTFIPVKLCPLLTKEYFSIAGITQSIFSVLTLNFGIQFVFNEEISEAVNILEEDAKYLDIATHKPVISSAMISYDSLRQPLLYENTIFKQSLTKENRLHAVQKTYA